MCAVDLHSVLRSCSYLSSIVAGVGERDDARERDPGAALVPRRRREHQGRWRRQQRREEEGRRRQGRHRRAGRRPHQPRRVLQHDLDLFRRRRLLVQQHEAHGDPGADEQEQDVQGQRAAEGGRRARQK